MNLRRTRYQHGSLTIEKRRTGVNVWVYRYREYRNDGAFTYRKKIVGPLSEVRTRAAAQKAVEGLKLDINAEVSAGSVSHTVAELISHYKEVELGSGRHTARVQQVYPYAGGDSRHTGRTLAPCADSDHACSHHRNEAW